MANPSAHIGAAVSQTLRAEKSTQTLVLPTRSARANVKCSAAAALLTGSLALCLGCQAIPGLTPDFGPPLDNFLGILLIVVLGTLLYRLLIRRSVSGVEGNSITPAEAIVRERYARGEITQEEYDRMLRTLTHR